MDPISLIGLFAPAVTDGIKGLINKWTGGAGAKPASVEEAIQLMDAEQNAKMTEIERLKALHQISHIDNVSQWVNNVRAMQRPVVALIAISTWVATHFVAMPIELAQGAASVASTVVFYLFGERAYLKFKEK